MSQKRNPTTGKAKTPTIHTTFFPVETRLWKMLIIAQTSAARIKRPNNPENSIRIVANPSWIRQVPR
jgi:hypothetical protein